MASWDRRPPAKLAALRQNAVRRQVVDAVGPFSPWWRERLAALGRTPAEVASPSGLAGLPAVGERDVCPDGDPAGAAALVLQAGESGWTLHAEGPRLRRALTRRLAFPSSYAALVESDTRATSFIWAGLGLRFPVASTRSDLDVIARAGARLWQVLGLSRADVVVSALPAAPTAAAQALSLGALGAGAPLLAPGDALEPVAQALRLVAASVLVAASPTAAELVGELGRVGAPLGALSIVLLVGAPAESERAAVRTALDSAGASSSCVVLAVHVPDGHRLAWGECRSSQGATGLHTYPDLELVDVVDPESGEQPTGDGAGELVLSQLGMRGSALLRWRTGDLVDAVDQAPCDACGRTVPRVLGTRRGALVPTLDVDGEERAVDLRAVAGALVGRPDVQDWRVVLGASRRDGLGQLLVHVAASDDADLATVAAGVATDVRAVSGLSPSQVVLEPAERLPAAAGALGPRVLVRSGPG